MINNIIFLDIDGVLNSDKYFSSIEDKEDTYIDPVAKLLLDIDMTKVKLLLKVVSISHAKIVISSTWRRMKLYPSIKMCIRDRIKTMMSQMGRTPSQKQVNQMMKQMNKFM